MSEDERECDPEARTIYVLCIVVTVPFIIAAFARGATIGPGTTICMIIAALGIIGLVVDHRRRTRLPEARVVDRR